eukprot:322411_1
MMTIIFITIYSIISTYECSFHPDYSRANSPMNSEYIDVSVGHTPYSSVQNSPQFGPQRDRSLVTSPVPLPNERLIVSPIPYAWPIPTAKPSETISELRSNNPYPDIEYESQDSMLPYDIHDAVNFIEWTIDSCYCPSCSSSGFIKLDTKCKYLRQSTTKDDSFDELFQVPNALEKTGNESLSDKDEFIINKIFAKIINQTQKSHASTLLPLNKSAYDCDYSIQTLTALLSNPMNLFGLKNGYHIIDIALHESVKNQNLSTMGQMFEFTMKFAAYYPLYKPTVYTSQYCIFILFAQSQKMEKK